MPKLMSINYLVRSWFALSVVGVLIAYIYQQAPPASRLFEKSQEYTVFYTDAYKAKSRGI